MLCAISGVPPQEPVVSMKSGHVFEKRLIEKHLQVSGTCPVTKEELDVPDLLPVKGPTAIKPRAPDATSLPSLIGTFQNEWDSVMLETFTLKQHLEATRQELAHALYQHDAACRVIARLIKERDEARAALGNTQSNVAAAMKVGSSGDKEEAGAGISGDVLKTMQGIAKTLSKGRKKLIKSLASGVTSKDDLKKYRPKASHPLHSASKPGITALDIHAKDESLMLTGGADGNAIIFNRTSGKIVDTLQGHKKKVTSTKFHPNEKMLFTTSTDNTAIIWAAKEGKYSAKHVLRNHTDDVCGASLHPSGQYLVTASADKTWAFYDVNSGICRKQVSDDKITGGYTQVSFHPDGLILAAGTTDSIVRIFDVTLQKNVYNCKGHAGKVTAMAFSENGYYLASGDEKGVVKLWDLRKLENFHTITPAKADSGIGCLSFDTSGSYLTIGGDTLGMYTTKGWELVKTWSDHKDSLTAVKFGSNAGFFATTSKDRTLKIYE